MGDTIKLGLIGCGSRGTGAAFNALSVNADVRLVTMGDVFADKAERAGRNLRESDIGGHVAGAMKTFGGFDAYRGVVENCDVVILAAPPHFQAEHLRAAVDAGRHVFVEAPAAVDIPGVKRLRETFEAARAKNLSVLVGFPHRYEPAQAELIRRIHEAGEIGEVVSVHGEYLTGGRWMNPWLPGWDDMTWQLRDWRYFCWLSGDFVTCDAVATIDTMLWLMRDTPPACVSAAGGRSQRTSPAYGNIYDHFNATIEWAGGQRGHFACRQWNDADQRLATTAFGTAGLAELHPPGITVGSKRVWIGKRADKMYELEQWALFDSIRAGKPINDGERLIRATAVALMIRTSAYTGKTVYWDRIAAEASKAPQDAPVIWESTQDFTPPKYGFGPMPVAPIPVPGQTKFV